MIAANVSADIVERPANDLHFEAENKGEATMRRTAVVVSMMAALAAAPALADPVADFYKGKQIRFIIRSNVGGTYDLYARLLARHMTRHIPGNPTILPVNMGGGG